jgi:hypothetical protein
MTPRSLIVLGSPTLLALGLAGCGGHDRMSAGIPPGVDMTRSHRPAVAGYVTVIPQNPPRPKLIRSATARPLAAR